MASHRRVDRGNGLPIYARLTLVVAVALLSIGVLYVGAGGLSRVAGAVGSSLTGFMDDLVATPSPSASAIPVSDAPMLEPPAEPYTSEAAVDLVVTVPARLAGDGEHRIRVFQQLQDQQPAPIGEWPMSSTQQLFLPVVLEPGINDFSAIIIGPGGASESSPSVRYVLDNAAPKITVSSPKENGRVNGAAVKIEGKTQARATLIARNEANDASISAVAEGDGTFVLSLPLAPGSNVIQITSTDPAGNAGSLALTVRRGSGKLAVALTATAYTFSRGNLPDPVRLAARVTDPDGKPLAGASVTFTVSVPGIATIAGQGITNGDGRVSFQTTIPKAATVGQGLAAVLVTTSEHGTVDDRVTITIEK